MNSPCAGKAESKVVSPVGGLSTSVLGLLGNLLGLAGLFVSTLASVSAIKGRATALEHAEERLARLQQEMVEVDLQLQRARRGR